MNTNPRAKRILCFGDFYTWGYRPLTNHLRFDSNTRWTGVLQEKLGDDFEIIEEGLNSRSLDSNDPRPGKEGRDGSKYLIPCLDTHDPVDLVILMLGSNELKENYGKTVEQIVDILEQRFVGVILNRKSQFKNSKPKLLLIAPPIIDETKEYARSHKYKTEKSKKLSEILRNKYIKSEKLIFVDSNDYVEPGDDGVHIDETSHKKLAEGLFPKIKEIL